MQLIATMAQADTYFSSSLNAAAWAALTDNRKEAALKTASAVIYAGGYQWRGDTPETVINACCEEALAQIKALDNTRMQLQREGVKSASVGSASETFADILPGSAALNGLHSLAAYLLLKPYKRGSVPII